VGPANLTARTLGAAATPGTRYAYRVRATVEELEAVGTWITGKTFRALPRQNSAGSVTYSGTWRKATTATAYGGSLRYASTAGRTVTTRFTGYGVAWVSALGKTRGKAEVWLDGKRVATISLYAKTSAARRIVWWTPVTPSVTHKLVIKVLGTHAKGATGNRVDMDAFIVLAP
jgi:hypothetical protein